LAVPPTREASSGMGTDGYDAKLLSAELVQMMRDDIGP
jgi:hypothetical protein